MNLEAAVVKEQGVRFAVVAVKRSALSAPTRDGVVRSFNTLFPGVPVVLMSQDGRGIPTFWGRQDIVRFLASVPVTALPWRRYRVS